MNAHTLRLTSYELLLMTETNYEKKKSDDDEISLSVSLFPFSNKKLYLFM